MDNKLLAIYYASEKGQVTYEKESQLNDQILAFAGRFMNKDQIIELEDLISERVGIALDRGVLDGCALATELLMEVKYVKA